MENAETNETFIKNLPLLIPLFIWGITIFIQSISLEAEEYKLIWAKRLRGFGMIFGVAGIALMLTYAIKDLDQIVMSSGTAIAALSIGAIIESEILYGADREKIKKWMGKAAIFIVFIAAWFLISIAVSSVYPLTGLLIIAIPAYTVLIIMIWKMFRISSAIKWLLLTILKLIWWYISLMLSAYLLILGK